MIKWEYNVVEFIPYGFRGGKISIGEIESKLNSLGRDGWELVQGTPIAMSYGQTSKLIYTLKRLIEEK